MSNEREMRRHARDGGSQAQALQGWGMLLGGSALAVYAVTRRRPSIALAAAGGLIGIGAATGPDRRPRPDIDDGAAARGDHVGQH